MLEKFSKNRTLIERIALHIWRSKFYRDYFKTEKEKIENKTIKYIHLLIGFIIFIFVFFLEENAGFKFNFERVDETQMSEFLDELFDFNYRTDYLINYIYWLFIILFIFYWWRLRNFIYYLMNKFHKFL
jgi:hypothetical protein